jgi:signal transduction histidine kinase
MLYLRSLAGAGGAPDKRLPVAELTALGFERALLAPDMATREHALRTALARDPALMAWAICVARGAAEHATDAGDAISWLVPRLEIELAAVLTVSAEGESAACSPTAVESRLPALVKRLAECAQKVAQFEARLEREKLDAMKELAYGASHEINNPLANIAARAQALLEEETDPERRRKLVAIHRQAMRAHEMIADLMLFARPPKLSRAPCDVAELARAVTCELKEQAGEQGTQLDCGPGNGPLVVSADATQLAVAIHAVARNALEALGEGGHVQICARRCEGMVDSWAEISVCDNGPGISDEIRPHLFDPFFSGREAGRGLGFGLSKCWRIVTEHGGKVVVHQPAKGGTEIIIQLPLASQ